MKNYIFSLNIDYFKQPVVKNENFSWKDVLLQLIVFSSPKNKPMIHNDKFGNLMLPALAVNVKTSKDMEPIPAMKLFNEFIGLLDEKGNVRKKSHYSLNIDKIFGFTENISLVGNFISDKEFTEDEEQINIIEFTINQSGDDCFDEEFTEEIMIFSDQAFEKIINSDDEKFNDEDEDYSEKYYPVFMFKLNQESIKKLSSYHSKFVKAYKLHKNF